MLFKDSTYIHKMKDNQNTYPISFLFVVCCAKYCRCHQKNLVKRSMHCSILHNRATADGDNTFLLKLTLHRYLWVEKEPVLYKFNLMRIQYEEDSIRVLDTLSSGGVVGGEWGWGRQLVYLFLSWFKPRL